MAARVHDSVLQTLTLVQRSADDPKRVAALARRQERELRGWLYGDGAHTEGETPPSTRSRTPSPTSRSCTACASRSSRPATRRSTTGAARSCWPPARR